MFSCRYRLSVKFHRLHVITNFLFLIVTCSHWQYISCSCSGVFLVLLTTCYPNNVFFLATCFRRMIFLWWCVVMTTIARVSIYSTDDIFSRWYVLVFDTYPWWCVPVFIPSHSDCDVYSSWMWLPHAHHASPQNRSVYLLFIDDDEAKLER